MSLSLRDVEEKARRKSNSPFKFFKDACKNLQAGSGMRLIPFLAIEREPFSKGTSYEVVSAESASCFRRQKRIHDNKTEKTAF